MSPQLDSLRGVRALVVEDEILIAEELSDRLTRLGARGVDIVDTGERAIQMAQRQEPGLILMDIRLKGSMDGVEAADIIRRSVAVPVVFLTAHSDQDTVRRVMATEPFGYILKPFDERALVVAVEMSLHRHGLEQRLRESERRYAATLASIGDGVIATDPEGRITFMNPVAEALTRWHIGDARGRAVDQVFKVVTESTLAPRENPCLEALRLGRLVSLAEPVLLVGRNAEMIPIDDSAAPITDVQGKLLGSVVAFRDIRQRRLSEDALRHAADQLRQAQKMEAVGRLAGGIAHDFNNILTVINGTTDLLLAGNEFQDPARMLLGEIEQAGRRAADLTRQLLMFGRRQVLQPAPVQLADLIGGISRMLERLLGEDVVLSVHFAPGLRMVHGDPAQLEQVIMNLAVNSRDAMPRGGRLTIDVSNVDVTAGAPESQGIPPGRYVRLEVRDSGVGMSQTTLERVFEPFFTTKDPGMGTGLGLSTVYGIVQQSGGFIDLDSVEGQGTRFVIHLPAFENGAGKPTSAVGEAPDQPLRGTETVLLVEDDEAVRTLVAAGLRRYGYTVHAASGSTEALRLFAALEAPVHLVLTDVVMRDMSGREMADRMHVEKPDLRVLFMSGYTEDAVLRHGVPEGHVAFLRKPFTVRGLARKVREVLDG